MMKRRGGYYPFVLQSNLGNLVKYMGILSLQKAATGTNFPEK